jgi:integrase/recombinase XerD
MTLDEIVVQYVAVRKSMGDDFTSAESLLRTFCRHVGENIELAEVTADQVQNFLVGTGIVSGYWRRKYDVLRGLYRYSISRGFIDQAPLPRTAVRAPQFKPYIYTVDELRRLLHGISTCLCPPRKLEPHTLRAILLLLYGAGLRIGEVVALTMTDVESFRTASCLEVYELVTC